MKDIFLTIIVIVGGLILLPFVCILAPFILALADEEDLRENGYFLSSRERDERYNQ